VRKLGQFAYRRRRGLTIVAGLVAVVSALGGASVFNNVKPFGFQDPASQSSKAYDAIENATGQRAVPDVELLVQPSSGNPGAAASPVAARLRTVAGIKRVVTPESDRRLVSSDGKAALVLGFISSDVTDLSHVGSDVRDRFAGYPGVSVGGSAVTVDELTKITQDDLRRIELFALPILLLLSLVVFRGLVAALLPVVVGGISILTSLVLLNVLTTVMDIDAFAINIVTGLGLGLAIDYSLFLVTRFREELERTDSTEGALVETTAAIGPMIVFSGLTVALSLIALWVFPQRFLYSIGIGGALVALSSAAVCLLLLPAVLGLLGDRINALAPRRFQGSPSNHRWHRLARIVLRYPVTVTIVAAGLMIVAGLPFLRVELTQANAKILPTDASARQVEDVVAARFPFDPADRIVLAFPTRRGAASAQRELASEAVVVQTDGPQRIGPRLYRTDAQLRVDGYSDRAVAAVKRVRSSRWGSHALVGGPPAELTDERHSLASHLPLALAFILVSTGLVLFFMTASVTLPIVALIMNTLTVSVAFGVLVLIFQDGRLQGPLGYVSPGGLDTSMPILLFAVVFGLSTDYGVFLLQRIGAARSRTDNEEVAIADGVAASGRTITAAALLFAVAMGAFAFSQLVYVKEVAIGAAVAVLVDATVVRAFLFPAVLRLLGAGAWWAPKWLARFARPRVSER
jgi:RND superfamily putative drug exporter